MSRRLPIAVEAALEDEGMSERIRLLGLVEAGFQPRRARTSGQPYNVFTGDAQWFADNIPCQAACPAQTDVPRYIALLADGRFDESYALNRAHNVFPGCLGRVCARPCEDACRRGHVDAPVAICSLKRLAADRGRPAPLPRPGIPSGRRVAIVGAGPTGLAAARELATWGHRVDVFEQYPVPGGMLWAGVPEWRLPRAVIRTEVGAITELGVSIHYNARIGQDIPMSSLVERFDAVLLAVGCQDTVRLGIPGEDLDGVVGGLRFLEQINLGLAGPSVDVDGKQVVVVGGGFTSIDCARSAVRSGATRTVLAYRRGRREIPIGADELREAENEGIEFAFHATPSRIVDGGGRAVGVEFIRQGPPDDQQGPSQVMPADLVIVAIGQRQKNEFLSGERVPEIDQRGVPIIDHDFRTTEPTVWAVGDYAAKPRNFITAIAEGKQAAAAIHRALTGGSEPPNATRGELTSVSDPEPPLLRRLAAQGVVEWTLTTFDRRLRKDDDYVETKRQAMPVLPLAERAIGSPAGLATEVELGLSEATGALEASRCLQCQLNIFLDASRCILCGSCIDACPQQCIEMVAPEQLHSIDGIETGAQVDRRHDGLRRPARREWPGAALLIDEEACIRCGRCVDRCPTGCLTMEHFRAVDVPVGGAHRDAEMLLGGRLA
jgi:formate dehydrogenase major subunit